MNRYVIYDYRNGIISFRIYREEKDYYYCFVGGQVLRLVKTDDKIAGTVEASSSEQAEDFWRERL